MTALRETGWAKLNLTLEVLGRRADGFHELRSLVAFADLGDDVELEPDGALELEGRRPLRRMPWAATISFSRPPRPRWPWRRT